MTQSTHRKASTKKARPSPDNAPPSERERIEWLLGFLRRDFSTLRRGEGIDLAEDVRRYLNPTHVTARPAEPGDEENETLETLDDQRATQMRELQATLKVGVQEIERERQWRPFPQKERWSRPTVRGAGSKEGEGSFSGDEIVSTVIGRLPDGSSGVIGRAAGPEGGRVMIGRGNVTVLFQRLPDGSVAQYFEGNPDNVLIMTAATLLMHWWPALRRCAHCRALFLPRHGRQQYHDPACSFQARWKKFAPKRKRDYHTEYKSRLRGGNPQRRGPRKRAGTTKG